MEKLVDHKALDAVVRTILVAAGSEAREAAIVAEHLIEANLRGHDSHGVSCLPSYVKRRLSGETKANRHGLVRRDDGPFLVIDGGRGFGQVIVREAMDLAIARARETGVVVAGINNCCHTGRIGTYGEQCADAGLVSLHFVNISGQDPYVAPFRGRDPRFSTNPFCFALPGTAQTPPLVLDFATSRVAWGKIRVAQNRGERIGEGLLLDADGRPTTDPSVIVPDRLGVMLPFGEHKGSGIALMCEILGGALSGGVTVQPGNPRDGLGINNMLSIVIDPARMVDLRWLAAEIDALTEYVRSAAPADARAPVLLAGDPERATRQHRLKAGIPLDESICRQLGEAAASVGLDPRILDGGTAAPDSLSRPA